MSTALTSNTVPGVIDTESLLASYDEEVSQRIVNKITEAETLRVKCINSVPAVFVASLIGGGFHVGVNFQNVGTKPGETFSYDYGITSLHENKNATVVWVGN